jgi:hypothetical protein
VQRALEAAGVEFIERGVRRRRRTPEEIEARARRCWQLLPGALARREPPFTEDDLVRQERAVAVIAAAIGILAARERARTALM